MDPAQTDRIVRTAGQPEPRFQDVGSPQAIVNALYDVISGPAEREQERDWDRFRSLFLPQARFLLVRWRGPAGDEEVLREWDIEQFIAAARDAWAHSGFWEREIWSRVERFGNIAHVFSTYESRVTDPASEPVGRGINSVQVVQQRDRWWIVNTVWDIERPANPIPPSYLPASRESSP